MSTSSSKKPKSRRLRDFFNPIDNKSEFNFPQTKQLKLNKEDNTEKKISGESKENKSGKKSERKFCASWFTTYPWLIKFSNGYLACKWCLATGINTESPYGTKEGTKNYRTSSFDDHKDSRLHKISRSNLFKEFTDKQNHDINAYLNGYKMETSTTILLLNNVYRVFDI